MACKSYANVFTILLAYLFILNSHVTATITSCSALKNAGEQKPCVEGSLYKCVDISPGHVREFCFCPVGKKAQYSTTTCVDIDECSVAEIEDLCNPGYVEGFGYCGFNDACTQTPVDCERKSVPMCGNNTCTNHVGGYTCSCPPNSEHQPYKPGCQSCQDFATCEKYGNIINNGSNSVCSCSEGRYGLCCEFQYCLTTRDRYIDLNVEWSEQRSNETSILDCDKIHSRFVGIVRRKCSENSKWEEADYSECLSEGIKNLKVELMQNESNLISLQNSLDQVIKENTSKLYPFEIIIVNKGLETLVTNYIEAQMKESPQDVATAAMKTPQVAIETASLLLEMANRESWVLAEKDNEFGNRTTVNALVDTLEQMSISLNRTKNENQTIETITDENAALTYNFIGTTSPIEIQYPNILINDTNHFKTEVRISQKIIEQINNKCKGSFFTSLHFPTVKSILPSARLENKNSDYKESSTNTTLESDVISLNSKVCGNANLDTFLGSSPIQIQFSLRSLPNKENSSSPSSVKCAFWNLTSNTWSMQGVTTKIGQHSDGTFKITCTTTHLTSFALLLSSHEPKGVNNTIQRVLSYIVCSMSVLALLASLTCYAILYIRTRNSNKNPFKNQDSIFIIHINLCIALLLGLLVFLFSSVASGDLIACTVVAAIQHYLWLTVFSWSLCEGIAIVWKIKFWNKSQRLWPVLIPLGWTLAIPVLVITVTLTHTTHHTNTSYVNPEVGCILTNTNHLKLLSFVLPMLMLLPTNFLFYIYTLYVIYRVKKRDETSTRVRSIIISSLVLLPLLALPWIVGVIYINEATVAFGYLFIIFIGLQGVFFFLAHVARNEEVIEYVFKWRDPYAMKKFVKLNTLSSQSSKVSNTLPTNPSNDEDDK